MPSSLAGRSRLRSPGQSPATQMRPGGQVVAWSPRAWRSCGVVPLLEDQQAVGEDGSASRLLPRLRLDGSQFLADHERLRSPALDRDDVQQLARRFLTLTPSDASPPSGIQDSRNSPRDVGRSVYLPGLGQGRPGSSRCDGFVAGRLEFAPRWKPAIPRLAGAVELCRQQAQQGGPANEASPQDPGVHGTRSTPHRQVLDQPRSRRRGRTRPGGPSWSRLWHFAPGNSASASELRNRFMRICRAAEFLWPVPARPLWSLFGQGQKWRYRPGNGRQFLAIQVELRVALEARGTAQLPAPGPLAAHRRAPVDQRARRSAPGRSPGKLSIMSPSPVEAAISTAGRADYGSCGCSVVGAGSLERPGVAAAGG